MTIAPDESERAAPRAETDSGGRPAEYGRLLKAVIYRDLLIWVRYPVNAAMGLFMGVFFFALMFYGGRMVAGRALTDSIEGLIVGYFLWTLALGAYMGVTNDIQSEASWGTLERHFLTPLGFGPVVFAKAIAIVFRTFLTSFVVLAAMLFMTGTTLDLNVLTIVVVGSLAIASAMGLGLAMGGLGVLYKRISNIASLFQFVFIGLISAPVLDVPLVELLPLVQGSAMLQLAMQDGVRLWEFAPGTLGVLVGTAAIYLGLGYGVFVVATGRARRLGVLGDY
jgi:ABC-2 type transport system permease protein